MNNAKAIALTMKHFGLKSLDQLFEVVWDEQSGYEGSRHDR